MALQVNITLASTLAVPNAYAAISGFNMDGLTGILVQVAFYATAAAQQAGAPAVDNRQYLIPNPVQMSFVTPFVANGAVDVMATLYAALQAIEADFAGATVVA